MDVREAAIALFNQEWKDFQDKPNLAWTSKGTLCTNIQCDNGIVLFIDCYFHVENVVVDLAGDIIGEGGWIRIHYSDPTFPNNLIELLYRRALDYICSFRESIPLFEQVEQTLNLLIAKHKHLHMGYCDRDTSILEVSSD